MDVVIREERCVFGRIEERRWTMEDGRRSRVEERWRKRRMKSKRSCKKKGVEVKWRWLTFTGLRIGPQISTPVCYLECLVSARLSVGFKRSTHRCDLSSCDVP